MNRYYKVGLDRYVEEKIRERTEPLLEIIEYCLSFAGDIAKRPAFAWDKVNRTIAAEERARTEADPK